MVALERIGAFLTAEELEESYTIDHDSKYAIDVEGDFRWEAAAQLSTGEDASKKKEAGGKDSRDNAQDKKSKKKAGKAKQEEAILPTAMPTGEAEKGETTSELPEEKPFELNSLKIQVQRGAFVAVVGRVGSGKVDFNGSRYAIAYGRLRLSQ